MGMGDTYSAFLDSGGDGSSSSYDPSSLNLASMSIYSPSDPGWGLTDSSLFSVPAAGFNPSVPAYGVPVVQTVSPPVTPTTGGTNWTSIIGALSGAVNTIVPKVIATATGDYASLNLLTRTQTQQSAISALSANASARNSALSLGSYGSAGYGAGLMGSSSGLLLVVGLGVVGLLVVMKVLRKN